MNSCKAGKYVDKLASFAATLRLSEVPPEIRERARVVILDTCAAIIAAGTLPEINALNGWAEDGGGPLLGALASGAAGVSLELDEGCMAAKGHPAIHVVPAALELGAVLGASGAHVLEAVIAGYEVSARIGAATRFREGIHPHGTWGACGAATAAGVLHRLEAETLGQAIRIASAFSFATNYRVIRDGATVRNLWTGLANALGIVAVNAARFRFTGSNDAPADVFGKTLGVGFDEEVACAGLGSEWYLAQGYFKTYACCRHTHPAIDALRAIIDTKSEVRPDDIDAIETFTYGQAAKAVGAAEYPESTLAAKFSLPYIFAAYLQTGSADRDVFCPPLLFDRSLRETAAKVHIAEDPAYSALVPGRSPARVTIRFKNGNEETVEVMEARGDPTDAGILKEVEAKFLALTVPRLGDETAHRLMSDVLTIDTLPGVAGIVGVIRRGNDG